MDCPICESDETRLCEEFDDGTQEHDCAYCGSIWELDADGYVTITQEG